MSRCLNFLKCGNGILPGGLRCGPCRDEAEAIRQTLIDGPVGVDKTLTERGNRYGDFNEHARITQNIKRAMQDSPNWKSLPDNMKEALEMDAHKIGRILNGDPYYADSWHDIIGYTRLVEKELPA